MRGPHADFTNCPINVLLPVQVPNHIHVLNFVVLFLSLFNLD